MTACRRAGDREGAGVTAVLVNRYFGSKEQLFAEVVADTMASPTILTKEFIDAGLPSKDFAAALVALTQPGATPLDGIPDHVLPASSKRAAEIGRGQIENHHQRVLAAALGGTWPRARRPDPLPWSPASR